jgi:hypothetical protein
MNRQATLERIHEQLNYADDALLSLFLGLLEGTRLNEPMLAEAYPMDEWDKQMALDFQEGRLDDLITNALKEFDEGQATLLTSEQAI